MKDIIHTSDIRNLDIPVINIKRQINRHESQELKLHLDQEALLMKILMQ